MTTATPDMLAAVRANTRDVGAWLALADAYAESGDELRAITTRCTADPDNDAWRMHLADYYEREAERQRVKCPTCHDRNHAPDWKGGNCPRCWNTPRSVNLRDPAMQARAALVRCQVELAVRQVPSPDEPTEKIVAWKMKHDSIIGRAKALEAEHGAAWRRGPKCKECKGKGEWFDGYDRWKDCLKCDSTGDVGGLMRRHRVSDYSDQDSQSRLEWQHRVTYHRGTARLHCTLAEAVRGYRCGAPTMRDGECVNCFFRECNKYVPSDWLRRVVRHHPDVTEVHLTDRELPNTPSWHWFSNSDEPMPSSGSGRNKIPNLLMPILAGYESLTSEPLTCLSRSYVQTTARYRRPEAAHLALARAVALWVRLYPESS